MPENLHPQALAFQKLANAIRREHGIEERALLRHTEPIYKNARAQLKALVSKRNTGQTKVLVTGLPRSGTGYISSLLSSHPNSFTKGEVFDPAQHSYNNYVQKAQELAAKRPHALFSLKFLAFQSPSYPTDLMDLGSLGWKIIGLHRKNKALQALSYYLATAFDTFHRFHESKSGHPIKVHVDLLNVVTGILIQSETQLLEYYKELHPFIQVVNFEKDIVEESRCIDLVSRFLGIPANLFQERERPTFPNTWELISNADEIREWLSKQLA